jgi:hypothetical protein
MHLLLYGRLLVAAVATMLFAIAPRRSVYADNGLPNLMLGNHDLVRF